MCTLQRTQHVYHLRSLADTSMVMYRRHFYEALNNKKAISYDMDNPPGHQRHCNAVITAVLFSVWFTDMPMVWEIFLIQTTFSRSKNWIYRALCPACAVSPFIHFSCFNWYWAEVISLINVRVYFSPWSLRYITLCHYYQRCFLFCFNCHISVHGHFRFKVHFM